MDFFTSNNYDYIIVGGGIRGAQDIKLLMDSDIDGCLLSKSLHLDKFKINHLKKSLNSERLRT